MEPRTASSCLGLILVLVPACLRNEKKNKYPAGTWEIKLFCSSFVRLWTTRRCKKRRKRDKKRTNSNMFGAMKKLLTFPQSVQRINICRYIFMSFFSTIFPGFASPTAASVSLRHFVPRRVFVKAFGCSVCRRSVFPPLWRVWCFVFSPCRHPWVTLFQRETWTWAGRRLCFDYLAFKLGLKQLCTHTHSDTPAEAAVLCFYPPIIYRSLAAAHCGASVRVGVCFQSILDADPSMCLVDSDLLTSVLVENPRFPFYGGQGQNSCAHLNSIEPVLSSYKKKNICISSFKCPFTLLECQHGVWEMTSATRSWFIVLKDKAFGIWWSVRVTGWLS